MGGHIDSYQTQLLQKVDFVGQSYHLGEFKWSWLFTPRLLSSLAPTKGGRLVSWFL
jgi:hypothetical protein